MSCNGCRVLRKGCNDNCVLRPCLQWIQSADAQGNATVFVAKFFGRAGLMGFIGAVPEDQRAALFQSLLYEACGRTVNPVHGALGLLWSGKWSACEAAVETVLKGGSLKAAAVAVAVTTAAGGGGGGIGVEGSGSLAPGGGGAGGSFPFTLPRYLPPQAPPLERAGGGNVNPGLRLGLGVMPAMAASRPSSCRARSSFTAHNQHSAQSLSQSQEEVRQQGLAPVPVPVRTPAHDMDNASEISSAGTGTGRLVVEERTGVGEEMKLREMLLRGQGQGHEWSAGRPRAVNLPVVDGDGEGDAKEDGDAGRRTWQQSVKPASGLDSSSILYSLWCGVNGEHSGSRGRVMDTRVKRELEDDDVRMGNQAMSALARRVQPRLEFYSNSASAHPDLQRQQRPAAPAWDRCEMDAREMEAKPLPAAATAACAVELNLALNTYSLGKSKEQQQQQQQQRKTSPGQAAGGGGAGNASGRVSSPSCGSVNSEGSVTSLDSSKSAVSASPWTLQLASALQSNRQLLPLLR